MSKSVSAKKIFEITGFFLGWISVGSQFILMIQNRQADISETIIRFFSFFTILTNILVALFFTAKIDNLKGFFFNLFRSKGSLTAVTTFILIVGLVYQFILRKTWHPTGLQMIVDELLHTLIPLFMLGYWLLNVQKENLQMKSIFKWLLYPVVYLILVMTRGYFSHYYPYPFINRDQIGVEKVLVNSLFILIFTIFVFLILKFIGNYIINLKTKKL
ncbi:Pr6Pr family membrane protein [Kaistella jeonii]|uniref:Pr6Pr family membrane protein n=1 Tax=Kaistella jeonii TaxID=266749 RepID=UPI00068A0CAF|nr:Pr6Pr family membrane protein [Kaistella jeonii]